MKISASLSLSSARRLAAGLAVTLATSLGALGASPLLAEEKPNVAATVDGLQVRMKTTDHSLETPRVDDGSMRLAGGDVVFDLSIHEKDRKADTTTIFHGDHREFLVIDHAKESYTVLDPPAIDALVAQIQSALSMLDEQIAEMPPEQRELVRKALDEDQKPVASEVRRTEDRAEKAGFSCVRYEVWRGGERIREAWVAPWSEVPRADELQGALSNLDAFFDYLAEAFSKVNSQALGGMPVFDLGQDNPFRDLEAMGGFPVVTRNFDGGELTTETVVEGIESVELPRAFARPPAGYERRNLTGE